MECSIIEIAVPYSKRHLSAEIKQRGGRFDPATKKWALLDSVENRALLELIQRPITGPTPVERARNVAATATELLNALRYRNYRLVESGDRVVIESTPLVIG